jgi:6-pyruvoyltetrahydropterin/6-carboxytetrahydropterin synthase
MRATVSRKVHFNAAHRLNNPDWDNKRNAEIFGKCNYPNYHGHNYDLIVKVTGEIDPQTGFVIDLKELKDILELNIIEPFDHHNFNLDIPEFKNLNPTAENISVVIWNILRTKINKTLQLKVVLFETERNFVEYEGE